MLILKTDDGCYLTYAEVVTSVKMTTCGGVVDEHIEINDRSFVISDGSEWGKGLGVTNNDLEIVYNFIIMLMGYPTSLTYTITELYENAMLFSRGNW